jgi:hypothetical protein
MAGVRLACGHAIERKEQMKLHGLLVSCLLFAIPSTALAGAEDMQVYAFGEPGCEYMMSTNVFELGPGESVMIELDVSECTPQQLGTFLYYGYSIKGKKKSVPLTSDDNVRLTCTDTTSLDETITGGGPILMELESPTVFTLSAKNMRRRGMKVRLRSNLGL